MRTDIALTTYDLDTLLKRTSVTRGKYLGAFPSCVIPRTNRKMYAFISNTDEHDNSGEHWCAWVVKDKTIIFFDSFGREPWHSSLPIHFQGIVNEYNHVEYNNSRLQNWGSSVCGYFCIHFIYVLCMGLEYKNFLNEYSDDKNKNE